MTTATLSAAWPAFRAATRWESSPTPPADPTPIVRPQTLIYRAGVAAWWTSPMTRADGKRDRDEMFVEYTKSICPVCKVVVDAQVNIRHDKVYLRKRCREHGSFEALVYGDAQMYLESARFNKPGTFPLRFQTEVRDGCPSDCGLCPDHKQHACLGLIEVNTHCNLDCPICFADSGHQPDGYAITAAQCERMLDTLVAAEGEPEVVMFSGGEPTIHKQLLEFVDAAQARPVKTVIINTNGIRLASDRRFVDQLATRNRPGHPVHIYLQFDGLDEATHRRIRGHDLRDVKQRALDNRAAAGLTVAWWPRWNAASTSTSSARSSATAWRSPECNRWYFSRSPTPAGMCSSTR